MDTDFGPTSFQIDLNKFREATSDDFMTSFVDPKRLINVLRIPLYDLHNIEIFKRSNVILDFKSEGVSLRNGQDSTNTIHLRAKNLREYAFNAIRKICVSSQSLIVDYNFISSYMQIMKKLKIADLSLYMENQVKQTNSLKLHLIGDGENLLLFFVRKCKYETNAEADFIAMKKLEASNYKSQNKVVGSEIFNNSYPYNDGALGHNTPEDENIKYQAKRIKRESTGQHELLIKQDQVKTFKLHPSNKKQIIEERDYSINEEISKTMKQETLTRKEHTFFQSIKEKSISNTFELEEKRGLKDYGSTLKNLMCNQR